MKKLQLFLIHFAGGNCYSYNLLKTLLTAYFDVEVLELPGRGKRITEPLIKDSVLASTDLYIQLKSKLMGSEYLIYGHGMGAILGFLVTKKMEQEMRSPMHLIVTGNNGPGRLREKCRYNMPTTLFVQELKKLGGIPNELFENEELFRFYEPILRADFEIVEKESEILVIGIGV